MNIYGDNGNVVILKKRLEWRGIYVKVSRIGIGEKLPADAHLIIGGGGQNAGQLTIADDLIGRQKQLRAMRDDGVVMLMICGMYQLFGHYFKTAEGITIPGAKVIDAYTLAGNKRIVGNIAIKSCWETLVGYENHSGKTYLGQNVLQLGIAKTGQGNNGEDNTEGAIQQNVFCSYLHGPMLAKSPQFADELLARAIKFAGGEDKLPSLPDELAMTAKKLAISRPR